MAGVAFVYLSAISPATRGQAATFTYALCVTGLTRILCRNYEAATAQCDEVVPLAREKGAALWNAVGTANKGCILAVTGKAADAVNIMTPKLAARGNQQDQLCAVVGYHLWR